MTSIPATPLAAGYALKDSPMGIVAVEAVGDGVTSDVAAINAAYVAAAALPTIGSGSVLLLPKAYLIDGPLNPTGLPVTLRGSGIGSLGTSFVQGYNGPWPVPEGEFGYDLELNSDGVPQDCGTVLVIDYGATDDDPANAAVHVYANAGVENVTFWYPDQVKTASTPIIYPPAIHLHPGCNEFVRYVNLGNAYRGIYGEYNHRATISMVFGSPVSVGIEVYGGGDVLTLERCHFGPYWYFGSNLAAWVQENGTAYLIGRQDCAEASNCFAFGYNIGFSLVDDNAHAPDGLGNPTGGPRSCWGHFRDCCMDICRQCYRIEIVQSNGVHISGGTLTNNDTNYPLIQILSTCSGDVIIDGLHLFCITGKILTDAGTGNTSFTNNQVIATYTVNAPNDAGFPRGSSANTACVFSGSGTVQCSFNTFISDQPQVSLASTLQRAVVVGNICAGTPRITNNIATAANYYVAGNVGS